MDIISGARIRSQIIMFYAEKIFHLINEIDRYVQGYLMSVGITVVNKYILVGDKNKFSLTDYIKLKDDTVFIDLLRFSLVLKELGGSASHETILYIEQLIVNIEKELEGLNN